MDNIDGMTIASSCIRSLRDSMTTAEVRAFYRSRPEQHAKDPYGIVRHIRTSVDKELGQRRHLTTFIEVRYVNATLQDEFDVWFSHIGVKSVEAMDTIQVHGRPLRASSVEFYTREGMLFVLAVYNYKAVVVTNVDEHAKMNTLDSETIIKE